MQRDLLGEAHRLVESHLSVLPIRTDGTKAPDGAVLPYNQKLDRVEWKPYQNRLPTPTELKTWFGNGPRGIAAVTGHVSADTECLDFDDETIFWDWLGIVKAYETDMVSRLVLVKTPRPGFSVWYRSEEPVPGNLKLARRVIGTKPNGLPDVKTMIETRGEGGYALIPPCPLECHETRRPYELIHGDLAERPVLKADERALLIETARSLNEYVEPERSPREKQGGRAEGERPGDLYNQKGSWQPLLEKHGWTFVQQRGDAEYWRRPGKQHGISASLGFIAPGIFYVFSTNASPFQDDHAYDLFGAYALLEHRGDFKAAGRALWEEGYQGSAPFDLAPVQVAEAGAGTSVVNVVLSLASNEPKPPDELEPEAFYGLPGELVLTISPHTESHPAAILASFLVGAGCLLGRGPHVYRDGARHAGNEFACLVGLSGASRKGTASRRVDEVFKSSINSNYTKLTTCHGLGSGEALVASLCEDDGDSPFADRRRLVFEEEFSRALKVMRREGSTLSENLRQAWDGGVLASRTKGKRLEAKESHVSVLGHITEVELRLELSSASMFNGFANRFLWFCTKRVRSLPFGGGDPPTARVISRFHAALDFAAKLGRMEFDDEAKLLWDRGGLYDMLLARPPGLLGAVTSRAESHVTRLALLYALLDADREIRVPHLLAALAVWDYSERSCAYIFGTSTGDEYADTIGELLHEAYPGGLTRTEIRDRFGRNALPGRIPKALGLLEKEGRARRATMPAEKGRPTEYWCLAENAHGIRQNDINDKSPLQRARELIAEGECDGG